MQSFGHFTQTTSHYSLFSLMYGHQFDQGDMAPSKNADEDGLVAQHELATHIEDFCDCV